MGKDHSKNYFLGVGERVIVRSYRVKGATGIITKYLQRNHHYWVRLDQPIQNRSNGKLSYWHKCNADNCEVI
jgi:protein involved in polysaccharide export with SLBB domain